MRNELKPFIVGILCCLVIASLFTAYMYGKGMETTLMIAQIDYSDPIGGIYGDIEVGQSFVATENNLTRIDVLFVTYNRENNKEILFRLKDQSSGEEITEIIINASEIPTNDYYNFYFDPIPDSKMKTYYFSLSSPESYPENAISIYSSRNNAYIGGSAFINGEKYPGDIAFRTYNTYPGKVFFLSFFEKLIKDRLFLILYGLILGTVIFGIITIHGKGLKIKD